LYFSDDVIFSMLSFIPMVYLSQENLLEPITKFSDIIGKPIKEVY